MNIGGFNGIHKQGLSMKKRNLLEVHASFISSNLEYSTMNIREHEQIVRRKLSNMLAYEMEDRLDITRQSLPQYGDYSIEYRTKTILISREKLDNLIAEEVKQELEKLAKEYKV